VFATELDPLGEAERRRRTGALDAALSAESYDLLRTTHDMSADEARATMVESATALLGDGAS
jgi:hypothetical protein